MEARLELLVVRLMQPGRRPPLGISEWLMRIVLVLLFVLTIASIVGHHFVG
jgi:hypothetical protein